MGVLTVDDFWLQLRLREIVQPGETAIRLCEKAASYYNQPQHHKFEHNELDKGNTTLL